MTMSPEPSLKQENLTHEMKCATNAIRQVLAALASGSRLELENLLEAFRRVQRVNEVRSSLERTEFLAADTGLNRAEADYRAALANWERYLPRLHGWLLAERVRLGSRNNHTGLVREWMNADRQTR